MKYKQDRDENEITYYENLVQTEWVELATDQWILNTESVYGTGIRRYTHSTIGLLEHWLQLNLKKENEIKFNNFFQKLLNFHLFQVATVTEKYPLWDFDESTAWNELNTYMRDRVTIEVVADGYFSV